MSKKFSRTRENERSVFGERTRRVTLLLVRIGQKGKTAKQARDFFLLTISYCLIITLIY